MLKDTPPTYNLPRSSDLSVNNAHEVNLILNFIDQNISSFRSYFLSLRDSDRENRISDFLVYHFNCCLRDAPYCGFPPFNFGKNPTQTKSGQETDIGVVVLSKSVKPITIIEFEAKRFSETSNNKEYVCGERGGMERFKKGEHASHLSVCGMFGYIQSRTSKEWIIKVNQWIDELAANKPNELDWCNPDEKLNPISIFQGVEKTKSVNTREKLKNITLYHYFMNLQ